MERERRSLTAANRKAREGLDRQAGRQADRVRLGQRDFLHVPGWDMGGDDWKWMGGRWPETGLW